MRYYKAQYRWEGVSVTPVEIAKKTACFVVFDDGRRESKHSNWVSYFPTAKDAAEWLLDQTKRRFNAGKAEYHRRRKEWKKAESILRKIEIAEDSQ